MNCSRTEERAVATERRCLEEVVSVVVEILNYK